MPSAKVPKPTGSQLYKKWYRGWALVSLSASYGIDQWTIEQMIRRYLVSRDARRKRDAKA